MHFYSILTVGQFSRKLSQILIRGNVPAGEPPIQSEKWRGSTVELKMAPGLKVGNRANAKATSIFGCRRAGDIFGSSARGMKSMERLLRYLLGSFPLLSFCAYALL